MALHIKTIGGRNYVYDVKSYRDKETKKVKYIDDKKNPTNIEATIKITKDTIEFTTPEVKLERQGLLNKTIIITLESGNYTFKTKK